MRYAVPMLGSLVGLVMTTEAVAAPEPLAPPAQSRFSPESFRSGVLTRASLALGFAPDFGEVLPFALVQLEGRYRYLQVDAGLNLGIRQDWIVGARVTPLLLERVGIFAAARWSEPVLEPSEGTTDDPIGMLSVGVEVPFGDDRVFSAELAYWRIFETSEDDIAVALQLGVGTWLL